MAMPARSVLPLLAVYGPAMAVSSLIASIFNCSRARVLFLTVRLTVFMWSLVVDLALTRVARFLLIQQQHRSSDKSEHPESTHHVTASSLNVRQRIKPPRRSVSEHRSVEIKQSTDYTQIVDETLHLFLSSYVTLTFLERPLSNTIETILLATVYVLIVPGRDQSYSRMRCVLLGSVCAFGCFVRITFPAFAAPLIIAAMWWSLQDRGTSFSKVIALPFMFGAALMTFVGIVVDSFYFSYPHTPTSLVFTPLNNLMYNMNVDNLSIHGLHFLWTHVFVNLPLLFGPIVVIFIVCLRTAMNSFSDNIWTSRFKWTSLASIVTSLFILSLMPHQEARFLLPLIVPLIVFILCVQLEHGICSLLKSKIFIAASICFNVLLALFFGFMHQAGVVPFLITHAADGRSELELGPFIGNCLLTTTDTRFCNVDDITSDNYLIDCSFETRLYFYKVFTPPLSMLAVPQHQRGNHNVTFYNLAGLSMREVLVIFETQHLSRALNESFSRVSRDKFERILLVMPHWILPSFGDGGLTFLPTFSSNENEWIIQRLLKMHIGLDDLSELMSGFSSGKSMALSVFYK